MMSEKVYFDSRTEPHVGRYEMPGGEWVCDDDCSHSGHQNWDQRDAALASALNGSSEDYSHLDDECERCGHGPYSHDPICEADDCECMVYEERGIR